jgi:hypothetical protein
MNVRQLMRYAIVAVGLVLVAAGTAAATLYYDRARTPDDVRRACGLVNDAYDDANKRITAVNDNLDQSRLAHPYRVSDVWRAAEQAKLEQAVGLVRERLDRPAPDDRWFSVAMSIDTAARTMDPGNQAGQLAADAAAAQGDYSTPGPGIDASSVGQENALGNVQAACVGR